MTMGLDLTGGRPLGCRSPTSRHAVIAMGYFAETCSVSWSLLMSRTFRLVRPVVLLCVAVLAMAALADEIRQPGQRKVEKPAAKAGAGIKKASKVKLVARLAGFKDWATSVAVSPDGKPPGPTARSADGTPPIASPWPPSSSPMDTSATWPIRPMASRWRPRDTSGRF